ncbi:ATP-binding protein [Egbenema bharatensis]|uniref:ATP-binding protein n=1 Tax=Egbenema bharatensis TaxID=3463334 RepID=UPI003A83846D
MTSAPVSPSPLEEIHAALKEHNPFAQAPILKASHVWGKGFPDVESLNAHASDAVFQALGKIRSGRYSTTSILITAQDGTGKTHIISRIRHRLQAQGGALFVYANQFDDLNRAKQGFQSLLADGLSNIGRQGMTQWQELATMMANDAIKAANLQAQFLPAERLIKKFEDADEDQAKKWINQLTKAFRKARSVKNPDVVRAIFWTLCDDQASYASNWLGGKELAQYKANELSLPTQSQSFDTVLQVLALISEYNELVICFDELDVPECNDGGLHKAQVIAGLVKELFENLHRGVILSVMMPGIWNEKVKQMPAGVWSRMTAIGEPYDLQYMNGDNVIELVARFLQEFYAEKHLIPPHALYPFDEHQLKELGRERLTARRVLVWCRENCKPPEVDIGNRHLPHQGITESEETPSEAESNFDEVELAFNNEIDGELGTRLDNNSVIANALFFGFQTLVDQTVERVSVESVSTGVKKRGGKDKYLNFKILGKEDEKDVCIGVAVLQHDGGRALGAGLRQLLDEENNFGLTRGCLVRSKNKSISSFIKKTYIEPLCSKGGEFVDLKEEEIKPLIAINAVYEKREVDYNLTEKQIFDFIAQKGAEKLLGSHNPLLQEILSDPSYQVPSIESEPEALVESDDSETDSDELQTADMENLSELTVNG